MNFYKVSAWWLAGMLTVLLSGCDTAEDTQIAADLEPTSRSEFTLAVVPYLSAPHLFDAFSPLASYLEDEIGKTVRIRTAADFDEFMTRTLEERYDLVVSNPYLFLTLHKRGGYKPIVADSRPFQSALIVSASSAAQDVAGLKGKRIGLLSAKALAGHLLPVDLLKSAGLYKDRDYTAVIMPSFDVILTALLNGEVAAAAVWLPQYEDYSAETRDRTRILAITDEYAGDPYAVRGDLPEELFHAVQAALLRLNDHPDRARLLNAIGVQRFIMADNADYESMRSFADRNELDY